MVIQDSVVMSYLSITRFYYSYFLLPFHYPILILFNYHFSYFFKFNAQLYLSLQESNTGNSITVCLYFSDTRFSYFLLPFHYPILLLLHYQFSYFCKFKAQLLLLLKGSNTGKSITPFSYFSITGFSYFLLPFYYPFLLLFNYQILLLSLTLPLPLSLTFQLPILLLLHIKSSVVFDTSRKQHR